MTFLMRGWLHHVFSRTIRVVGGPESCHESPVVRRLAPSRIALQHRSFSNSLVLWWTVFMFVGARAVSYPCEALVGTCFGVSFTMVSLLVNVFEILPALLCSHAIFFAVCRPRKGESLCTGKSVFPVKLSSEICLRRLYGT